MANKVADVVICGAGIAGVATAYQLAVQHQMQQIVLVDPRPPLTLTSDKSTECYRNWWPGPGDDMVRLMNRSIELMDELHREAPERLHMNRRGYVYATAVPNAVAGLIESAREISALGAGPLRIHRGHAGDPVYVPYGDHGVFDAPDGADILLDTGLIRRHFPYLTDRVVAILHARRCGWFAAQQFGMYMLEQARAHGVQLVTGRVEGVQVNGRAVTSVNIATKEGTHTIATRHFVNAAGPLQAAVGQMMGIDIPVFNQLHLKVSFPDAQRVIPNDLPLLIWNDPMRLPWADDEREFLAETAETRWMVEEMPAGLHGRAEGSGDNPSILLLWDYHADPVDPTFPIPSDTQFPEIVLRGMAQVIPGLAAYLNRMPKPFIDGGYYTRTRENRPLIGPLPIAGAYILGGLSGFGVMAACGAAELLAAHITDSPLPGYAPAFLPSRYQDPAYQKLLDNWATTGQL